MTNTRFSYGKCHYCKKETMLDSGICFSCLEFIYSQVQKSPKEAFNRMRKEIGKALQLQAEIKQLEKEREEEMQKFKEREKWMNRMLILILILLVGAVLLSILT